MVKLKFEEWLWNQASVEIKNVHGDNVIFTSDLFQKYCWKKGQSKSFSGAILSLGNTDAAVDYIHNQFFEDNFDWYEEEEYEDSELVYRPPLLYDDWLDKPIVDRIRNEQCSNVTIRKRWSAITRKYLMNHILFH